jgi:hypothetical protein
MSPRNQYTIEPGQEGAVLVELLPPETEPIIGALHAISSVGTTICFDSAPSMALNQEAKLRFSGESLEQPVVATVHVQSRTEEGQSRKYGFWFVKRQEVESHLLPRLEGLFNRRSSDRVQPDSNMPVLVTLESNPPGARACGPLLSISTTGMAIRTSLEDEGAFAHTSLARASFALPGQRIDCVKVDVVLRQRRLAGRHVQFGLVFKDLDGPNQKRVREAIRSYVHDRQEQILDRRRAG